ncbi:hypothetical protein [Thalassoglobus sp.]|uniref:hypothetical protein n=1 Tax=Thalassoglobus sp. TaxID=2795869 RepID=UPI003AA7BDE9
MDFGFADVLLNGELTEVALFVMTLPYSDAICIQAFPREYTEFFQEGHVRDLFSLGALVLKTLHFTVWIAGDIFSNSYAGFHAPLLWNVFENEWVSPGTRVLEKRITMPCNRL